jgi:aspartate/methionine/tyrosine aminotransferase
MKDKFHFCKANTYDQISDECYTNLVYNPHFNYFSPQDHTNTALFNSHMLYLWDKLTGKTPMFVTRLS